MARFLRFQAHFHAFSAFFQGFVARLHATRDSLPQSSVNNEVRLQVPRAAG
jgi:hypothetical protein